MEPLTVAATLDSLAAIADYVLRAAAAAHLGKKAAYNLRLAVDEIATNIINYGYAPSEPNPFIILKAHLDPSHLTISLEDAAAEFNPLQRLSHEEACVHQPCEERAIGGLGILLAVAGVDNFNYARIGDRNYNTFTVNAPGKPLTASL